jgi:MFS family permease
VIPSVLVSISFAPILLSISPTPAFESTKRMGLKALYEKSPLGCVGMFLLGGVYSAQFGMSAVYGSEAGLTLPEISGFVAAFYVGAMLFQYPVGWLSDVYDRRMMVAAVGLIGAVAALIAVVMQGYYFLLLSALLIGGMSNPLYSLLIAHTNDFLEYEDMAAASAGLLFINGLGAITGPLITGWMMEVFGPAAFFAFLAVLLGAVMAYAFYRMTQRALPTQTDDGGYVPIHPTSTPVAVEAAQEYLIEVAQSEEDAA